MIFINEYIVVIVHNFKFYVLAIQNLEGKSFKVVEINSTKKAVALMNAGATWPEDYGTYHTFTALPYASPPSDDWYVPTQAELTALAAKKNAWGTLNGVNGCKFTIGGNTLFLPTAGYYNNGFISVSSEGYYWSSTSYDEDESYALLIDGYPTFIIQSVGWYKVDGLTVRPFHALPTP